MLILLIVCLIGIPSVLIFHPLGAAGTPAGVLGDVALLVVTGRRLAAPQRRGPTTPVHWALLTFASALMASYAVGMIRPITTTEVSSADRGMILLAAWCGMALMMTTGIMTRDGLDKVLRTLVLAGSGLAFLGIVQFFIGLDLASRIHFPGLSANHAFGAVTLRAGFRRVNGTALHAIEFGAVLSLILPLALHFAFFETNGRRRRALWIATAMIGLAIPLTVARSAMLGITLVLAMLFPTWTRRQKRLAIMLSPFGLVGLMALAPHLIGTLTHLFTQAKNDPSVQNRLGDYNTAGYYISQSPLFGRGFYTFLPSMYRTFDNEYMGLLVESGVVGFLGLIGLMATAWHCATRSRWRAVDARTRSLAYALTVSVIVALVDFFTFDAFSFPMCMGVFFLVIGATGCLWKLSFAADWHASERPEHLVSRRQRIILKAGAIGCAVVLTGLGAMYARSVPPTFQAYASVQLSSRPMQGQNVFQQSLYLGTLPELIRRRATSFETRELLASRGVDDYEVAIGAGSLTHDTDVVGIGTLMRIACVSKSAAHAQTECQTVMDWLVGALAEWQTSVRADRSVTVVTQVKTGPDLYYLKNNVKRAELMTAVVASILSTLAYRGVLKALSERAHRETMQARLREGG